MSIGKRAPSAIGAPGLRTLVVIAVIFSASRSPAQKMYGIKDADELVAYATRLATRGEAVKIGESGVAISGQTLSGEAVRRPADALARAAEIYAEAAHAERSRKLIEYALRLWRKIGRPHFAIPYLRLYSKDAAQKRDAFALYCSVQLADLYESIGDPQSADEIYAQYLDYQPTEILEVYAVANTSERLLNLGRTEEAKDLAERAVHACDPNLFSAGVGEDGYTIAVNVLKRIPGASLPSSAGGVAAQGGSISENDPRALLLEGNAAARGADYVMAISKWEKFQQRFPNEDAAREVAIRIAQSYVTLKQVDKAIAAYSLVEARYPEFPEWWQAVQGKAALMESSGDGAGAIAFLKASLAKCRTPEASAQITLALAETSLRSGFPDDAVSHYITLMTTYAQQDASRSALNNLFVIAPRSRDWKRLAQGIKEWFISSWSLGSRSEFKNMSVADASRIRRIVLSFYARYSEVKDGVRWLSDIGKVLDSAHAEALIRDEAWLYARNASALARAPDVLTPKAVEDAIGAGVAAWTLAPKSEEGYQGIKAAVSLATSVRVAKRLNKDLENTLRDWMAEKDTGKDAYALLLGYYEFLGEKKAMEDLKRRYLEVQ